MDVENRVVLDIVPTPAAEEGEANEPLLRHNRRASHINLLRLPRWFRKEPAAEPGRR